MINVVGFSEPKERILVRSVEFINEEGWNSLTVKNVSESLGLSSASIYKHFENLEEIKAYICLLCFREFFRILSDCCEIPKPSWEKLQEFAHKMRKFAIQNPGLFQASFYRSQGEPQELQTLRKETQSKFLILFHSYQIPKEKITAVSRSFRGLLFGTLFLEIQKSFGLPEKPEFAFREAVEIFLDGLDRRYLKRKESL